MLRITELRLPLNHADDALRPAIVARLGIADAALERYVVFKRSYDARKKTAIQLIYTIDCELADEAGVAARLQGQPHIRPTPDTGYHFIGHASAPPARRPRRTRAGRGPTRRGGSSIASTRSDRRNDPQITQIMRITQIMIAQH